ncbi:carbonic anhydrase [Usitatibacter palustris]|uniref:carbonic anhydrase n=1 Tax=Usitatibacter palustris TaxID=2732487 RepID=A0A6M4H9G5_9PROT|nr:carbonic anhydrase family protein [Usitatibacter palustris]QJR15835.1 Carbonic anhydrase [Usitatibacter palustris]
MKKPTLATLLVTTLGVLGCATAFADASHWTYSGEAGPANWSKGDPKNVMCGLGRNQSPIDIAGGIPAKLEALRIDYRESGGDLVNNGHTIQLDIADGGTLALAGRVFHLKQFHFHAPGENRIQGKEYPLEVHLVHADKDGNLAVIGVMFKDGPANPVLDKLWSATPTKAGDKVVLRAGSAPAAASLLPKSKAYYRFNGSLTTPPCSEGVLWLVMKNPLTASKAQVEKFTKTVGFANNRPIQSVNARPVLQ